MIKKIFNLMSCVFLLWFWLSPDTAPTIAYYWACVGMAHFMYAWTVAGVELSVYLLTGAYSEEDQLGLSFSKLDLDGVVEAKLVTLICLVFMVSPILYFLYRTLAFLAGSYCG